MISKKARLNVRKTGLRVNLKPGYPKKYMPERRRRAAKSKARSCIHGWPDGEPTTSEIIIDVSGDNILTFTTAVCHRFQAARHVSFSMPIREFKAVIVEAAK